MKIADAMDLQTVEMEIKVQVQVQRTDSGTVEKQQAAVE